MGTLGNRSLVSTDNKHLSAFRIRAQHPSSQRQWVLATGSPRKSETVMCHHFWDINKGFGYIFKYLKNLCKLSIQIN